MEFINENEDDEFVIGEYLKSFINGDKIYHADDYYTGYDDFEEMISLFKAKK